MRITTRKAGLVGLSSILLLAGALPAAAEMSPAVKPKPASLTVPAVPKPTGKPAETVPTDTKISRDQAVELARKYVQIPEDFNVDNVSFYSHNGKLPDGSNASWNISFSKREGDRHFGNVNVSIHADSGKLINFHSYYNDPDVKPSYPPKTGLKEAKPLAEAFLKGLYPEEWKETRYNERNEAHRKTPLNGDVRYQFRYDRTVNGILFPQNGFSIDVDGNGRIVGFQSEWVTNAKFEEKGTILTEQEAAALWKKESSLMVSYFKPFDTNKRDLPMSIAYHFKPVVLDAITGKVWPEGSKTKTELEPLTTSPLGDTPKAGAMLTKDQALAAVTAMFSIPKNAKLENVSYNEYNSTVPYGVSKQKAEGFWNIHWSLPENEETSESNDAASKKIMPPYPASIHASVNASTGEIRSFSINQYRPQPAAVNEKEFKVTFEEAKTKAFEAAKKLAPYMTHQLYAEYSEPAAIPDEKREGIYAYPFTFKRMMNGIQAAETLQITIDRKTGEISNYYSNLSNEAYPDAKPELMDSAKALELWSGQFELQLQYTANVTGGYYPYDIPIEKYNVLVASGDIPMYAEAGERTYKLIYTAVPKQPNIYSIVLDAVTGDWMNANNGEKAVLGKIEASDTAGHWAGRELDLMVEYNALELTDGKVNPDRIATRGEMIKMLLTAMNGGYFHPAYDSARPASYADVGKSSAYFAYVENAVDQNLIDRNPDGNFNPDAPMTREEMAELIVRALGYHELAKVPELFKLNVADAEKTSLKGHVALVLGLGIMTASDENVFLPKSEVTRAQAAAAFFRYLEKRGALQQRTYMY